MVPTTQYKKGDKIGGQYKVHQVLVGGMAEVYLCRDIRKNLPFALKTLHQRLASNPKALTAFNREISTWISFGKHPNIVQCYQMLRFANRPFMLLEWVAGPQGYGTSLHDWLRRGPLNLKEALEFAIDVCRGLIYVYEIQPGLVHRDLKPSNILIDQNRYAKISDFGLAKVIEEIDPTHTSAGQSPLHTQGAGTPLYMAPEQWTGQTLDQRADIYAIGCILYEMMAGCAANDSTNPQNPGQPPQLAAPIPLLPDDLHLNPILKRCLAKSPDDRFDTVAELFTELNRLYQQEFGSLPRVPQISEEMVANDYTNRAATYLALRKHKEALKDYDRAIELEPSNAKAYSERGLLVGCHLGRYAKGVASCDKAIELEPSNPIHLLTRARLHFACGYLYDAIDDYTYVLELNPLDIRAYLQRGEVYCRLGKAWLYLALADFNKVIEIDPLNRTALAKREQIQRALMFREWPVTPPDRKPSLKEELFQVGGRIAQKWPFILLILIMLRILCK